MWSQILLWDWDFNFLRTRVQRKRKPCTHSLNRVWIERYHYFKTLNKCVCVCVFMLRLNKEHGRNGRNSKNNLLAHHLSQVISECFEIEKWGRPFQRTLTWIPPRLFVLFLEAWNINIFCTFEIACGACLAMAAWASNILVCWERRITRDSLQTRAGTAAQSCSSFESFYCLNLSNFKQVKLIFRMKRLSCRPARFSG